MTNTYNLATNFCTFVGVVFLAGLFLINHKLVDVFEERGPHFFSSNLEHTLMLLATGVNDLLSHCFC